jgi:photosystem II stability/assembly factor-like uncharacterized protein
MKNILFCLIIIFLAIKPIVAQTPISWTRINTMPCIPITSSGTNYVVDEILALNADTMFALTGFDPEFIFISTDDGKSWQDTKDTVPHNGISLISDRGIMLHGGIANSYGTQGGLFRSSDFGDNWKRIYPDSFLVTHLIKGREQEYFVSGSYPKSGGYIFRSMDDGLSWYTIYKGNIYEGNISNIIYGKDHSLLMKLYNDNFIIRSSNLGVTWDTVFNLSGYSTEGIDSFVGDTTELYVVTEDSLQAPHFYSSISGLAGSWIERPKPPFRIDQFSPYNHGSTFIYSIYISLDTGNTWEQLPDYPSGSPSGFSGNSSAIGFDKTGRIFIGTTTAILRMNDSAASGTISGLPLDITGGIPDKLLATSDELWISDKYGEALYHSFNSGETWNYLLNRASFVLGIDGSLLRIMDDSLGNSFLQRSYDGGISWNSNTSLGNEVYISVLYFGERAPGKLFVLSSNGVYYHSEDNGKTWDFVTTPLNGNTFGSFFIRDSINLYFGFEEAFFATHDGGMTWKNHILPDASLVTAITSATDGAILAVAGNNLVRSMNDGFTWGIYETGIQTSIFDKQVINDLLRDANGKLYAATNRGVYVLLPGQNIWNSMNNGLTDSNVLALSVQNGSTLYATCSHSGIYRADIVSSSVNATPQIEKGLSIYPNPASSSATISYSLSKRQSIKLEIIDQLGRTIRLLRNESEDAGMKTISISTNDLPEGIYFILFTSIFGTFPQKVVKIK